MCVIAIAVMAAGCDLAGEVEDLDLADDAVGEVSAELTTPAPGAVAKPAGWTIQPPWAAGVQHRITHGYGTNLHTGTNTTGSANDHHALDFDLAENEAVYPIADGTVIFAGAATVGWKSYGKIVFIEHLVDGVKYHSLYAHLNQIWVGEGPITRSTALGGAGGTGGWQVHLHLAVYKNAKFQNSSSGIGPYGGQSMVPEPFADCDRNGSLTCENLVPGDTLKRRTPQSCGSSCTQCVLAARPDILPFYQANGWDISCWNQDNIVNNWCGIDPAGCSAAKNQSCASVCGGGSCGSSCTQCVLAERTDILPFYQANGWDTSCWNRDNIVNNWCGIDPAGCSAVKNGPCASVCGGGGNPYPDCTCPASDNYCHIPPSTPGCPMTYPGGYCDDDGNHSYDDADWVRGYNDFQAYCL